MSFETGEAIMERDMHVDCMKVEALQCLGVLGKQHESNTENSLPDSRIPLLSASAPKEQKFSSEIASNCQKQQANCLDFGTLNAQ